MNLMTHELQAHWLAIGPLFTIHNAADYRLAIERLNRLIDTVGTDAKHPLYELLDALGTMIHAYEQRHHPIPASSGAGVLAYLMEEHGLTQSELPEIGSQGVVSEILRGKRELNVRQMRALSVRFGVSPAVFF